MLFRSKKQVEKIEKAHSLREELAEKYSEYLKREDVYLKITNDRITQNKQNLQNSISTLDAEIQELETKTSVSETKVDNEKEQKITEHESELRVLRNKKSEISREIGKIEGMIEYDKKRKEETEKKTGDTSSNITASMKEVEGLITRLERVSVTEDNASYESLKGTLLKIHNSVIEFRKIYTKNRDAGGDKEFVSASTELLQQKEVLQESIQDLSQKEETFISSIVGLRAGIEKDKGEVHESEKVLYEKKSECSQFAIRLESVYSEESRYSREVGDFEEEIRDGVNLIGANIREYHNFKVLDEDIKNEGREEQESRRRHIERIKIRIEDIGGSSGEDVMKEHQEAQERDEFLTKEVDDLTSSATALRELITGLNGQLDKEFELGVVKINKQFEHFFALMFGGGTASLSIVSAGVSKKKDDDDGLLDIEPEDEPEETGIEIAVSLPRKKIRGLQMLSGGERALTSIALLFAVSQVNPPPFMILDETDAALDEANSRKYGDMLENLSKVSQLIVDRKSTRLNSSHIPLSRMPSSA